MQKEVNSITEDWRFDMKTNVSLTDNLLSFVDNQMKNCYITMF